jgi:hypothetical protein
MTILFIWGLIAAQRIATIATDMEAPHTERLWLSAMDWKIT